MRKTTIPLLQEDEPLFSGQSVFKHKSAALISMPQLRKLSGNKSLFFKAEGDYYLLFLLSGAAEIRVNGEQEVERYSAGQMILVPMGLLIELRAEGELECLAFPFLPSIHLCARQCPEKPTRDFSHLEMVPRTPVLTHLPFSRGVELWTKSILEYLQYSLADLRLFDVKLQELFLLLRMNYARKIQDEFLRFFHCKHTGFVSRVFKHHLSCRKAEDLAEKLGVSTAVLTRLFEEEFGTTPLKWLLQQRARYVYRDIVDGNLTFTEIAELYHLTSPCYLSAFCRRTFGQSPSKIRRGVLQADDDEADDAEEK